MAGARVTFHALPLHEPISRTHLSAARVEKDGSFQLSTYELHDGAPAGDYAVTVFWTGNADGPAPDVLRHRYGDPSRPVVKTTVQGPEVRLEPFQLKGPPIGENTKKRRP